MKENLEQKEFMISQDAVDFIKVRTLRQAKILWFILQNISKHVNWEGDETWEETVNKPAFKGVEFFIDIPEEFLLLKEVFSAEEIFDDFMENIDMFIRWKTKTTESCFNLFAATSYLNGRIRVRFAKVVLEWLIGRKKDRKFVKFVPNESMFNFKSGCHHKSCMMTITANESLPDELLKML